MVISIVGLLVLGGRVYVPLCWRTLNGQATQSHLQHYGQHYGLCRASLVLIDVSPSKGRYRCWPDLTMIEQNFPPSKVVGSSCSGKDIELA